MTLTDVLRVIDREISRFETMLQAELPDIRIREFRLINDISCNATKFDVSLTMINPERAQGEMIVVEFSMFVDGIDFKNESLMRRVRTDYPAIIQAINTDPSRPHKLPDFWLLNGVLISETTNITGEGDAIGFIGIKPKP